MRPRRGRRGLDRLARGRFVLSPLMGTLRSRYAACRIVSVQLSQRSEEGITIENFARALRKGGVARRARQAVWVLEAFRQVILEVAVQVLRQR